MKYKCALDCLTCVNKSLIKFGWIHSGGLGVDSIRDKIQMGNGGNHNILDTFFKKHVDN